MPDFPRTMRMRRLSGAEIEAWRRVAGTVTPRPGAALPELPTPPPTTPAPIPAAPLTPATARTPATATARSNFAASYTPPTSKPKPKPKPTGLERRFKRQVAIGRVPIEGVLDLHGMTQAEAHPALNHFLLRAQRDGARLVIVVTGKGTRERYGPQAEAAEPGVLRRAVPSWLRDGALRALVVGFEEASLGHGGAGALYVRLRRGPGG